MRAEKQLAGVESNSALRPGLEPGPRAPLEEPLGIQNTKKLDDCGDQTRPAGLMAGAQPGPVVAVEVFVEEDVVAPVGIGLELFRASIYRALAAARCAGRSGSADRAISLETSKRFIILPEPVGHSILKLSP